MQKRSAWAADCCRDSDSPVSTNSGWTDLYISHMNAPNSLFLNKGRQATVRRPPTSEARDAGADLDGWEFEEVGQATGAAITSMTFATWMFDFDQDGDL